MTQPVPRTLDNSDDQPGCLALLVYLVLLAAGLAILYSFFLEPFKLAFESMKWEKTPCTIIKSQVVQVTAKDKGNPVLPEKTKPEPPPPPNADVFKADIVYRYTYNGVVHRPSQIWFLKHSPDTRANAQEIVNRYPEGLETHCYVDPNDPKFAVLERGLKPQLLIALVPLLMVLIGAAGLLSRAASFLPHRHSSTASSSPRQRRGRSGLFPLIFILLFAAVWNFAVYFLVKEVLSTWKHGVPGCHGLFLTLFSIPFVIVGMVALILPFYFFLKLFNPRPTVTFSAEGLPLGGQLDIAWDFDGNPNRIFRLRIRLEGREEATYRKQDSTYTDREVFRAVTLIDTDNPAQIASGKVRLAMPPDTVPTFSAPHNRIVWAIKLLGEIHRWPDVEEEFDLNVLPAGSPPGRANS
jgi:hypothetical protein